jgi:hypothetical protein
LRASLSDKGNFNEEKLMNKTKKILIFVLIVVIILYFLPTGKVNHLDCKSSVCHMPPGQDQQVCAGLLLDNSCEDGTVWLKEYSICRGQCYGLILSSHIFYFSENPIVKKFNYLTGNAS